MSYLNGIQKGVGKDEKWSHILSAAILTVGICLGYGQEAQAMVGGKPVIGISWKSPKQAKSYEAFKRSLQWPVGFLSN